MAFSTGSERPGADPATTTVRTRRAQPTGLAVAGAGIVLFNIAPFLNWVDPDGAPNPRTGYETDSLVPFIAYLGLGLLVALVYAMQRARRGQHRGLTLVSMAVGIAAALQCTAFALNPMGGLERGDDLAPQIGVFVGILGAAIWAIGSGLLAKEIEGDDDRDLDTYRDGNVER
jgi:ABC-type Fe3+-siderophore transport system permease subunit